MFTWEHGLLRTAIVARRVRLFLITGSRRFEAVLGGGIFNHYRERRLKL
jgi:hypothetical protein